MTTFSFTGFAFFFTIVLIATVPVVAQQQSDGKISGTLNLDDTWESEIYLSYIPTFDEMYSISNENIISMTAIDSLGRFEFDIGFIPAEDNLFRLHIIKKGDAPASLYIGGKDENHFFFIANRYSYLAFEAASQYPPFRKIIFTHPEQNLSFQKITDLVNIADSIASGSGAAKRKFIENKLYEELLSIADSAKHPLTSLYAIYRGKFESRYVANPVFYQAYLEKWRNEKNTYFSSFRKQADIKNERNNTLMRVLLACIVFISGFLLGRFIPKKKTKMNSLSAQERKVFELLRQGASNQEISDQYHIEISTVKSHVSSIFSKLNVKSRKEIMNNE